MINIGTILFLIVNVPVLFQCCDPPACYVNIYVLWVHSGGKMKNSPNLVDTIVYP